ncbi:MAG: hypothetical protein LQ341_003921 [Variospora aurantia]|nr:MAG: hypothetical protein LQ341_003921 [Variospora aurantia]
MTAKVVYTSLKRKRSSSDDLEYHSSAQKLNLVEKPDTASDLVLPVVPIKSPNAIELSQSTLSLQGSHSALTTPSSESSGLPLTSENLHQLQQEEAPYPKRSEPSEKSFTSMAFPWTTLLPGKSSAKGIDEARDLITEPRHSAPSKQLLDEIDETRLHYSDRNETTFTNKFFGVFQSKCRQVKLQAQGDSAQPDNDEEIDDQADSNKAISTFLPDGPQETGRTMGWTRMTTEISNPQPDIIHGTSIKKHYTDEERAVIAQFNKITQVSMGLASPFLGVEVKTKGDIEEAANQACPEGASMVAAHRNLEVLARPAAQKAKGNETADAAKAITTPAKPNATPSASKHVAGSKAKGNAESNTSRADFSTKAYTMVLTPKYAQINVHWVHIGEGEGEEALTYHMHCIKSYALNEQDNLKACRAAVNNILDWGLGERDKKIKALLNQVHDRYKVLKAAKAKGKDKDKSVDKSPESKKRWVDEVGTGDSEIRQAMSMYGSGHKD